MTAKTYSGKDIVITYDASRCIHTAQCVRGAPLAFDPAGKPWTQPDKADAATLADVVRRRPTGALTAARTKRPTPRTVRPGSRPARSG